MDIFETIVAKAAGISAESPLAGVAEADIVRLSELISFLSYQMRVVAGLRLMADVA